MILAVGTGLPRLPAALARRAPSVFEIDQPEVIEVKTATLAELGADPTARPADRRDRPARRLARGAARRRLRPGAPTAWIAEGLLVYLPPEAQDRLFDDITALSRARQRSWRPSTTPTAAAGMSERAAAMSDAWRDHGFDVEPHRPLLPGRARAPSSTT